MGKKRKKMVYVVELRDWNYDLLEVDEVHVFESREGVDKFLREQKFLKVEPVRGGEYWSRSKDSVSARVRECEMGS